MTRVPFNYPDIEALCDERVLSLGRALWRNGEVRNIKIEDDGNHVSGTVRDAQPTPFSVSIQAVPGQQVKLDGYTRPTIQTFCTCPLGSACRHVVALCLEALDSQNHVVKKTPLVRPSISPLSPKPKIEQVVAGLPADMRSTIRDPGSLMSKTAFINRDTRESKEIEIRSMPVSASSSLPQESIIYVLNTVDDKSHPPRATHVVIRPAIAHVVAAGSYGKPRGITLSQLVQSRADYVTEDDRFIGKIMVGSIYSNREEFRSPPGDPELFNQLMHRLVASRRCFFRSLKSEPLVASEPKSAKVGWYLETDGCQSPAIVLNKDSSQYLVLPAAHPWYVDLATQEAGEISFTGPLTLVQKLLSGPKILPNEVKAVSARLATQSFPGLVTPLRTLELVKRKGVKPVPCLRLMAYSKVSRKGLLNDDQNLPRHLAFMHFEYEGAISEVDSPANVVSREDEGRLLVMTRDKKAEVAYSKTFGEIHGLEATSVHPPRLPEDRTGFAFMALPTSRIRWLNLLDEHVPALRAAGWRVDVDEGFAEHFATVEAASDDKSWDVDIKEQEGGTWWFSLDLGIIVEGQRVALLPLLMQALKRLGKPSAEAIETLALSGKLYVDLPDGRALALPFDRVRDIMTTLLELYDQPLNTDGTLNVSIDLAAALSRIESATHMRWLSGGRLQKLIERLKDFSGLTEVPVPHGLKATLRPYQREGLNWLQFLRDYDLGGILADDMGLGKTVQTLAHILIEKAQKRLKRPCLIICPTSLIPNWQDEAQKFAPELKVLSLHGKDRSTRFSQIDGADVVLTTYPLLTRDYQTLLPIEWHLVVLDEAQAIKNPTAQVTQLVCEVKARHRLCLTGTPIENHLGEVWSHFAFLMPGMLGSYKDFSKRFRVPIEKNKDDERRVLLARRLKPFILRRNKSDVAKELPPKTEIVHYVEFDTAQRDLYETLRLTMHEKVQEAVESKGLNKSRIVVLDALLKLRQACCDPRLVKLTAARKVTESAKLESLMDMLPEMIEEGRRILLFSQFTSMLDLIKPELEKATVPFVELRGDTTDRKTPVARFQNGEIPLFLISLKAGGTGLNLTAADTVIHYDPWWNPAVENQATDRAHRIGQSKTVFVYKFIAKGTVEERILDLQTHKRSFAASLLEERAESVKAFEMNDLDFLFQPSPTK